MSTLIQDPDTERALIADRRRKGIDLHDEVWEGVYHVMPNPNDEHQSLVMRIGRPCLEVIEDPGKGVVRPGVNVSDRIDDWEHNYRIPDLAVFLHGGAAECHDTFWFGGPDFGIEIVSPDDRSRQKLGFYEKVGTRELLLIDRDPWRLELYRLTHGELSHVGASTLDDPQPLRSEVLGLTWRLVAGQPRPQIEIAHDDGRRWLA
jgi:Uma2 family endonuclease